MRGGIIAKAFPQSCALVVALIVLGVSIPPPRENVHMSERVALQSDLAREAQVRVEKAGREVRVLFVLETAPRAVELFELLHKQLKSGIVNLRLAKPNQVVELPHPPDQKKAH